MGCPYGVCTFHIYIEMFDKYHIRKKNWISFAATYRMAKTRKTHPSNGITVDMPAMTNVCVSFQSERKKINIERKKKKTEGNRLINREQLNGFRFQFANVFPWKWIGCFVLSVLQNEILLEQKENTMINEMMDQGWREIICIINDVPGT